MSQSAVEKLLVEWHDVRLTHFRQIQTLEGSRRVRAVLLGEKDALTTSEEGTDGGGLVVARRASLEPYSGDRDLVGTGSAEEEKRIQAFLRHYHLGTKWYG